MTPYRGFGELLRSRRKALGLTLATVAERTKWSIPYISEIERGVRQPPAAQHLPLLAQVLGIPQALLIHEADISRRSIEIDLERAGGKTQRVAAVLLAQRMSAGISEEEATWLIEVFGELNERDVGSGDM